MKYLKIYEAFESKGISNTLKFLESEVGKSSSDKFLHSLRLLMESSGFPMDKISDKFLKYLKAKKALELRCQNKVTNGKGLWTIKFWFSIKDGYIGFSGTGNIEHDPGKIDLSSIGGRKEEQRFDSRLLNYVKNNVTNTGEIWPITDYSKLKTGDKVIGLFDSSRSERERITIATIFYDQINQKWYAIQDVASGQSPNSSGWERYGRYSWYIFSPHNIGGDNHYMHYYRPSSSELKYITPPEIKVKEEEEEEKVDPFHWNLPLSDSLTLRRWNQSHNITQDDIKKADFALVLYYDDMVNPDADAPYFEPVGDTRSSRKEERKGALALMTDDEIKRANIEKYIKKLSNSLNISVDEISNLEKIAIKTLLSEFTFFSIYNDRNRVFSNLEIICRNLYECVKTDDRSDKEYFLDQVKDIYSSINKNYYRDLMICQNSKKFIKGNFEETFKKIYEIGTLINQKVKEKKLETIDDLLILLQKLESIKSFMKSDINRLSNYLREIILMFFDHNDTEYYIKEYDSLYEDRYKTDDLKKLQRLESFVKSIL